MKPADIRHKMDARLPTDVCPADPEEESENYWLRHLPLQQARRFENHIAVCRSCARVARHTLCLIRAIRNAAEKLKASH